MSYSYENTGFHFGGPRITWAVQRLILANIIVFAIQLLWQPLEILLAGFTPLGSILYPGALVEWLGFQPNLFLRGLLYKPLTYQFLHGGIMHLFMNMLWLYFFGPDVERTLGTRQFFRFYLICGALAVLAAFVPYFARGSAPTITGASGAVMAVLMAFALIEPDRQFYLFPLPVPITARALVVIIVVMNVITGLNASGQISVATHLGGLAVGYAYIRLLPRVLAWQRAKRAPKPRPKPAEPEDKLGEAIDNIFKFEDRRKH